MRRHLMMVAAILAAVSTCASAHMGPAPPPEPEKPSIRLEPLAEGAWCLYGRGGNIGVVVTPGAVFMVDTQFDSLAPSIQEEVKKLSPATIRYVVNTHYHYDHTDGNRFFAKTADIVGHENVRVRLYTLPEWQQRNLPPLIQGLESLLGSGRATEPGYRQALESRVRLYKSFLDRASSFKPEEVVAPTITYADSMKIFLGDEEVQIFHVAPGHTDGDSIVYFPKRKVVHMGDLLVTGTYPFIDLEGGGSSEGWMKNLEAVLGRLPQDTRVIPGHGEVGTMTDVKRLRSYMSDLRAAVSSAMKAGKSLEEAIREIRLDAYADLKATFMSLPANVDQIWREMGGKP